MQRTSSDLRLNSHLHVVVLDGASHEQGTELYWKSRVLRRQVLGDEDGRAGHGGNGDEPA